MARPYQKRNSTSIGFLWIRKLMLSAFIFSMGYLTASFLDVQQLSAWFSKLTVDKNSTSKARLTTEQAQLPKPKLEFYTLLTKHHTNNIIVPKPLVPASAETVATVEPPVNKVNAALALAVKNEVKVVARLPAPFTATAQPALASKSASTYTIQIAAFRTREDAEHLKASLLLKGFEASVQAIAAQRVTWFRVMVGPFASREQAEKMQTVLATRQRVSGMIRKMDV